MVLVLALADVLVPQEAARLHPTLLALLTPGKVAAALVAGNLGPDPASLTWLRSLCSDVTLAQVSHKTNEPQPETLTLNPTLNPNPNPKP